MSEPGYPPDRRLAVAPARGRVSPWGTISDRRQHVNVSAGHDGVLAELLVHDGDLVDAGDPLARLYPEVSE